MTEESFIQYLKESFPTSGAGVLGIGDDCAVLPMSDTESYVVSTDSLVEGTHFDLKTTSAEDLGYKAVAVNLSDIAAMGGRPTYAFLSVACPSSTSSQWLKKFVDGLQSCLDQFDVQLLGGDTVRSNSNLFIGLTVVGLVHSEQIKKRSAARVGDLVYVTRTLGDSRLGFELLQSEAPEVIGEGGSTLVQRHLRPQPEVELGQWLGARTDVRAMMDLSDGLFTDIERMAKASNVGFEVDVDSLPISGDARRISRQLGQVVEEVAIVGGEDYGLLFTVERKSRKAFERAFQQKYSKNPSCIGEAVAGQSSSFLQNSLPFAISKKAFSHFS